MAMDPAGSGLGNMSALMELLGVTVPTFILVFSRTLGLLSQAPLFGTTAKLLPNNGRLTLGILLSFVAMSRLEAYPDIPNHLLALVLLALREFTFGAILGLAANLPFLGMQAAGEMSGQQVGLNAASVANPFNKGAGGNAISTLFNYVGLSVFVLLGAHVHMLNAFVQSFDLVPLGLFSVSPRLTEQMVAITVGMMGIIIQLAMPITIVVIVNDVGIAYMGKIAQQASSLTQDFTTLGKPIAGLLLLAILMPNVMSAASGYVEKMVAELHRTVAAAKPDRIPPASGQIPRFPRATPDPGNGFGAPPLPGR